MVLCYLFPPSTQVFQHGQGRRNRTKNGHFAGKYQILVNVPRQILHINVK